MGWWRLCRVRTLDWAALNAACALRLRGRMWSEVARLELTTSTGAAASSCGARQCPDRIACRAAADVGQALAAYLAQPARPPSRARFLTLRAPTASDPRRPRRDVHGPAGGGTWARTGCATTLASELLARGRVVSTSAGCVRHLRPGYDRDLRQRSTWGGLSPGASPGGGRAGLSRVSRTMLPVPRGAPTSPRPARRRPSPAALCRHARRRGRRGS